MNQEQTVKTSMASLEHHVSGKSQREDLSAFPFPFADHHLQWPSRGDARE